MRLRKSLTAAGAAAAMLSIAPHPASADHDTCGSGHQFQYNVPYQKASTGTVDRIDTSDFWYDPATTTGEVLATIVLMPVSGDTDLYVWTGDCVGPLCHSIRGTGLPENCLVTAKDGLYIEARNWGEQSSQYTVSVTYSALFI